jgi:hypothetical protein
LLFNGSAVLEEKRNKIAYSTMCHPNGGLLQKPKIHIARKVIAALTPWDMIRATLASILRSMKGIILKLELE